MSTKTALNRVMRSDAHVTGDLPAAGLKTDQVEAFYEMASTSENNSEFFSKIPIYYRKAQSGSIPRVSVAGRIMRRKTQATDDSYRAKLTSDSVSFALVGGRVPCEISEDVLEENITGEKFEATVLKILTAKTGVDLEDLTWNGDTTTDESDDDYQFLTLNNGLVKLVTDGGNTINGATYNSGNVNEDMFFDAAGTIPGIHITSRNGVLKTDAAGANGYRWLMSWQVFVAWNKYAAARADAIGVQAFTAAFGDKLAPLGIPIEVVGANFPDTRIMLAKPGAFARVYGYDTRLRKTDQGREAIMRDVRFYVIHTKADVIVLEEDASAIIYGLTV